MYKEITAAMKARMEYLESLDRRDRNDGTERLKRLRQIPPETGRFLALLASGCPPGEYLEIGTSAGYSAMWLSLAAKERSIRLKTFELLPEKIALAKETFRQAGIEDYVELIEGDALSNILSVGGIGFCFIDCEKEMYEECGDIVAPKVVRHGIVVADNAINHCEALKSMIDKAMGDERFDSLIVPIGKGELVCRRK